MVAMGVGMQAQAELTRATLLAQGVAAKGGMLVVAVTVLVVKVEQKETADWYWSVGVSARKARRQLRRGLLIDRLGLFVHSLGMWKVCRL